MGENQCIIHTKQGVAQTKRINDNVTQCLTTFIQANSGSLLLFITTIQYNSIHLVSLFPGFRQILPLIINELDVITINNHAYSPCMFVPITSLLNIEER